MSATALYGYLAFPAHERPSYIVRTREGKVVVPDVEIRRGSLRLVPIYPADPRPAYQQLADSLRARILSGELPPGSLLPSESELLHEYGISRGPIRQAVAQLKAEGLVDVRQGRGVFVRRRPTRYRLSADRFLHARRHADSTPFPADLTTGGTPRLEVRRHAVVEAPPEIADRLKLSKGTRVLARGFRLFADDEPVQVADFYLPYDLVKGTRVDDPASEPWPGGTIAQLESLGIQVTEIAEDVAARAPRPEEVRDLRLGAGTPVFEVVRTMFADERPIATRSIIIAGSGRLSAAATSTTPRLSKPAAPTSALGSAGGADALETPQGHGCADVPEQRRSTHLRARIRSHRAPERIGAALHMGHTAPGVRQLDERPVPRNLVVLLKSTSVSRSKFETA